MSEQPTAGDRDPVPWPLERSDELTAAMAACGIDALFFTSGSDILFFQEAIARASAEGRSAPRLISVAHESVSLSAALGYAAVSGKPTATAAHVDVGTLAYGAGIHNASRAGLPVLIMAGCPPTAGYNSMRGHCDSGHFISQQTYDQNGILRQYVKWDHRLEYQDDAAAVVQRALQVATSSPEGPVYLSIPREIAMIRSSGLTEGHPAGLSASVTGMAPRQVLDEVVDTLMAADRPTIVVSKSGRDVRTVPLLVELCEATGARVVEAPIRGYLNFPLDHPLYRGRSNPSDADAVLVIEAPIPWSPGNEPAPGTPTFVFDRDPVSILTPLHHVEATVRMQVSAYDVLSGLVDSVQAASISGERRSAVESRKNQAIAVATSRRAELVREASQPAADGSITEKYASWRVAEFLTSHDVLHLDSTVSASLWSYLQTSRPGSVVRNPSTAGGWGCGAAFGAKLARPEETIVLTSGDGFFMYDVPAVALMAAKQYSAPFMAIVFQNDSYNTGTIEVDKFYANGFAVSTGYEGGHFPAGIDFARLAESAGAWGRNVSIAAELDDALVQALRTVQGGTSAVVSIRLPKLGAGMGRERGRATSQSEVRPHSRSAS